MKKLIFTAFLATAMMQLNAAVLTVSNDINGGAQYSTLYGAYNAASAGDTLMLEGTDILYFNNCNNYWEKPLVVIGIGFNPQKQNPKKSFIRNMDCMGSFWMRSGASGSKFYGITFTVPVTLSNSVSNVTFEDCQFNSHMNFNNNVSTNFAFINCVFNEDNTWNINTGGAGNAVGNLFISNCIFDGYIEGNNNPYLTMIVDHSLFLSTVNGGFSQIRYATITNNIFMNTFPGGTTDCVWLNNMAAPAGTLPPAGTGNTGSGNINNTNPNFVTYTSGQLYSASHDYHLQAGSAAIAAGSDGTDLGLHGGTSLFSEQGEVLINPIMRSVIINNPVNASGGTLNVQIHATKPDDN